MFGRRIGSGGAPAGAFFPAGSVLPRAREVFPDLALAESFAGCRHISSKAGLGRISERVLAFLAGPDET